ncbi:MAG TPA: hypothetical protein VME68_05120 [Acidobacteriaceae bacterium]|nr:hypothetical protein [Acidobacteriaceae bacterium]
MKIRGLVVLLVMGGAVATAPAKNKKEAVPPSFCQAKSVYVQTSSGDPQGPGATAEDRADANALIAQLQNWKRYTVVMQPQQADLIWVVRSGRGLAHGAGNNGMGPNGGSTTQDASGIGGTPSGPGTSRSGQGGMSGAGGQGGMNGSGGQEGVNGPGGQGDSMEPGGRGNRGGAPNISVPDDVLAIFQLPAGGGPLSSPLWQRNQQGGLDMPKMQLFEQIRSAVEATCGASPAPTQPGSSPQ